MWVIVAGLAIVGVFGFFVAADFIVYDGPSRPHAVYWLLILGTAVTGGSICLAVTHAARTWRIGKIEKRLANPIAVVVIVITLLASSAAYIKAEEEDPLKGSDHAITYEIGDLQPGFYRSWDLASIWIYSGEPSLIDGRYVVYPITAIWLLNSSALTGTDDTAADFGARKIGDSWFELSVTDISGDGMVGIGDRIEISSTNGSFSEDTVYYLELVVRVHSGMTLAYNAVLGFELSIWGFDSWVQFEMEGLPL